MALRPNQIQVLGLSDGPETLSPTTGRWAVGEVGGAWQMKKVTQISFCFIHLICVRNALVSCIRVQPVPVFHLISVRPLPALAVISPRQCETSSSVRTLAAFSHRSA